MNKNYLLSLIFLFATVGLAAQTVGGIISGQSNFASAASTMNCDVAFSFPSPDQPAGLAFDGTHFYSSSTTSMLINKYDLNGVLFGSIPHPGTVAAHGDMDFDGTNLWVVSEEDGMLFKINPNDGAVITSFFLGGSTDVYGCAYEDGHLWISNYGSQTLMRINAETGEMVSSVPMPGYTLPMKIINGDLYGIAFENNSAMNPMLLTKYDKTTGAVIEYIPFCIPYSLGVAVADGHVWGLSAGAGIGTETIYKFDSLLLSTPNNNAALANIRISPNPTASFISVSANSNIDQIEIINMVGAKLYSGKPSLQTAEINIAHLSAGIYAVKVSVGGHTFTEQVIKQ